MPDDQKKSKDLVPANGSAAAVPATRTTCCNCYCTLINGTVFLWSTTNNLPLSLNTINQALKRLGVMSEALTATINTRGGIVINVMLGASFIVFAIGNQRTFVPEFKTVFQISDARPSRKQEAEPESRSWIAVDAISGIVKALARIASSAVLAYRIGGLNAAIASLPFTTIASLIANLGYFSKRAGFTGLTCLPPAVKKSLRYFSNVIYSLSTAILYFESLNAFLPHLAESHLGSDTEPMTSHDEWYFILTNIINGLGALTVLLATMGKFNQRIAGFLAEDPRESALPYCLQQICGHQATVTIAAIDKALIGASSAFALFFSITSLLDLDLDTGLAITSILVALGLVSSLFVQYVQLAPDPTARPTIASSARAAAAALVVNEDERLEAAEAGAKAAAAPDDPEGRDKHLEEAKVASTPAAEHIGGRAAPSTTGNISTPLLKHTHATKGRTNLCTRITQFCSSCWCSLFCPPSDEASIAKQDAPAFTSR